MDVEVIIQEIGEFGRFQLQNYILVCLPVFYAAANSLTYVFTSRSTKYRYGHMNQVNFDKVSNH